VTAGLGSSGGVSVRSWLAEPLDRAALRVRQSVGVESQGAVRMWRADVAGGCVCMSGTSSGYAVDPLGEYVVGVVVAGAMQVRRGRDRFVFEPQDICAWDPSGAHVGRPYGCTSWQARLLILETAGIERIVRGSQPSATDVYFARPRLRHHCLAQRFIDLHRVLETTSWALERETLLMDWLREISDVPERPELRRRARRDPALRRACELLHDEIAGNVTLDELAHAAGVSRHRLSRLFRAAYGMPPHRFQLANRIDAARRMLERGAGVAEVAQATGFFDQSHLHRHFRRTVGMTPARYARLAAQTYKTPRATKA
jgi:AraC-like DNA-binding protein